MTVTRPEIETTLDEATMHDLAVPCQFAGRDLEDCPDLPAEWVMMVAKCPECLDGGGRHVLACDRCMAARMFLDVCVVACKCGFTWVPAREAYVHVERLNKAAK